MKSNHAAEKPFNPGWAQMTWLPHALAVDFVFAGRNARNAATTLNQPTHLLGDVGEIFLQWPAVNRYIEIHVTPENQRLQLAWTGVALEAVRAGKRVLQDQAVADPDWVRSCATVAETFWSARVIIAPEVIAPELAEFRSGTELRASVCRYDYCQGEPPVLSSIVDYRGGRFHDRAAWDRVVLT